MNGGSRIDGSGTSVSMGGTERSNEESRRVDEDDLHDGGQTLG